MSKGLLKNIFKNTFVQIFKIKANTITNKITIGIFKGNILLISIGIKCKVKPTI